MLPWQDEMEVPLLQPAHSRPGQARMHTLRRLFPWQIEMELPLLQSDPEVRQRDLLKQGHLKRRKMPGKFRMHSMVRSRTIAI
jgi:hypothetical protein